MTRDEMTDLVEYAAYACPQQKIGKMTTVVWYDIIGHLEFDEAKNAVIALGRRKPFVSPSEIIAEVAAVRSASQPHSNACRDRNHADCRVTWCMCDCHPQAVTKLTGPGAPRPIRPAIEAAPEGERDVRELLDPAAYRREVEQADQAFMRKLAQRTGRKELRSADG